MQLQYSAPPTELSSELWAETIAWLMDRGAHFVLCRENKRPLWRRWPRRRPTLKEVLEHDGPVGIIPWSLRMTVLDADIIPNGACLWEMVRRLPNIAIVPSRRSDRAHIWLRDTIPRTNGKFECFGVRGDVRGASGYVIIWGATAMRLTAALKEDAKTPGGRIHMGQMQEWLLTQGGHLKLHSNPVRRRRRGRGVKRGNGFRLQAGGMPRPGLLSDVQVGERNDTIFDTLRNWAYKRRRGDDYEEWRGMVRDCAHNLNNEIPVRLDSAEVNRTADSVADFCWTVLDEVDPQGGPVDRESQARRGRRSGEVRRWRSVHLREDPEPWKRLGISRSLYYDRLKKYRAESGDRAAIPPDRVFQRCTEERRQDQRVRAARMSAVRRRERAGGAPTAARAAQRAGRNLNHQRHTLDQGAGSGAGYLQPTAAKAPGRDANRPTMGAAGPARRTGQPSRRRPRTEPTPHQRERAAVAALIEGLAPQTPATPPRRPHESLHAATGQPHGPPGTERGPTGRR